MIKTLGLLINFSRALMAVPKTPSDTRFSYKQPDFSVKPLVAKGNP